MFWACVYAMLGLFYFILSMAKTDQSQKDEWNNFGKPERMVILLLYVFTWPFLLAFASVKGR